MIQQASVHTCAWGPIEQHSLGLGNAKSIKELRVLDRQLNHLLDLLDLLVEAAHHLVGRVRHLLHHHQAHQGVHLLGNEAQAEQKKSTLPLYAFSNFQ